MAFKRCEVDGHNDTPTKCRGPAAGTGNSARTRTRTGNGTEARDEPRRSWQNDNRFDFSRQEAKCEKGLQGGRRERGQAAKAKTQKQTIKIK